MKKRRNKAWLRGVANIIAEELRLRSNGTSLRIRLARSATTTNTDGWRCRIGDIGKNQPKLEIWFDRFPGHGNRNLWAGFYTADKRKIISIANTVAKNLRPCRLLTLEDLTDGKIVSLQKPLRRSEFNVPILEKYRVDCFYGIYNPTNADSEKTNTYFCNWAAAFFETIARQLPNALAESEEHEAYPRIENRRIVSSHLRRERSRWLATECKIRDDYKCQVCGMKFEKNYGGIGKNFAEAHHLVPLSKLKHKIKTHLEDLITVCANCHRMLHKMDGERGDADKLKRIVAHA
jgi:5-methylcytosine-specific restriction endonuclease McrA